MIAAAGAVGCTGGVRAPAGFAKDGATAPPRNVSPSPRPPRPAKSEAPLPDERPFEPLAADAYPNAKRVAGRFVQALTTYGPGASPQQVLRAAAKRNAGTEFDFDGGLRRAAPLLVRDAASRGVVVYPQLAGLTLEPGRERAAVMVVVRQQLLNSTGSAIAEQFIRTVDVRLINRDQRWRIEDLADAGGTLPDRTPKSLPDLARRVLADARIELPDSARWDIMRGDIDERLLTTMLDLAGVAPYSVTVLKSGHPRNVFGTDLISGHTRGRGVDIWRIAGEPVVLQQPTKKSEAHDFTAAALRRFGVPELGSPWDLDGPPEPGELKPSFTDAVHEDHIHVAFKAA